MKGIMRSYILGLLICCGLGLSAGTAGATTYLVNASGISFSPADIVIALGDTVHWHVDFGNHTVTSGFDSTEANWGALFDSPLTTTNKDFFYTFDDTSGVYPYFCLTHLVAFGMTGTVTVEEDTPTSIKLGRFVNTDWGRLKELFRR